MKTFYSKGIFASFMLVLALIANAAYAQQVKIETPDKIKSIKAIPLRLVDKVWQEFDPNKSPVIMGENVRIRFEVTMEDGTKSKTYVSGLEDGDLKFNQFKYEAEGRDENAVGVGSLLTGNEVMFVSANEYVLNHDGRMNVKITVWHKKLEDKDHETVWPVAPSDGQIRINYSGYMHEYKNGMDVNVKVTVETINNRKYLKLDITRANNWAKYKMTDKFYLIDVETETVVIDVRGEDGGSPGDQSSYKTVGDDGYDGGDGGEVNIMMSAEALNYSKLINTVTVPGRGGRAGKGSINYGRDGRDGVKGKVTVKDL